MKTLLSAVILTLVFGLLFSYNGNINISINSIDIRVVINYHFDGGSQKITMPAHSRIINVTSPGKAAVNYYFNGTAVLVDNVIMDYGGNIKIEYVIPSGNPEFINDDWLATCAEKGSLQAEISGPAGYTTFTVPYSSSDNNTVTVNQDDSPILICGRMNLETASIGDKNIDFYNFFQKNISLTNVSRLIEGYENILSPLGKKNLIFIASPDLNNLLRFSGNNIFISVNSPSADDIKRGLTGIWFRGFYGMDSSYSFAYSDLYTRILDDNGSIRKDEAFFEPFPSRPYYENIIKSGFATGTMLNCGTQAMLKNFALLHLAFTIAGLDNFIGGIRTAMAGSHGPLLNLTGIFNLSPEREKAVDFVSANLLPIAAVIPELSMTGLNAFRNMESIPDTFIQTGDTVTDLEWHGSRASPVTTSEDRVIIDPDRLIPRLDYLNGIYLSDPVEIAERKLVLSAVASHKIYPGESLRSIMGLEKFIAPDGNAFQLPEGAHVYISASTFIAMIDGRFSSGIKELVISVNNGKPEIIAYRIRL